MRISNDLIKNGPTYLEQVLASQLNPDLAESSDQLNKYNELINRIEKDNLLKQKQSPIAKDFCLAHFYQKAANVTADQSERTENLQSALKHYQHIIKKRSTWGEEYFYACLSSGIIMQALGHPWPETEELLLLAHEANPLRGEPICRIIEYYLSIKSWPIAYIFSSFACDHFLDSCPPYEYWGIDQDFYTWKVLDLHITAALAFGRVQEASRSYIILYQKTIEHPELFSPGQIKTIVEKKGLFPKSTTYA